LERRLGGPQSRYGRSGEEKITKLYLEGMNVKRIFGRQTIEA
jgi:hypothetical protein